ncbi:MULTISPECIES: restriction endonuclease subunit S [Aeromonas]|uniref:restriction endonuclease subunit S n=1 Tax=Aeromonas TaxID=642 RepID=UPI0022DF48D3|nr:MULTISPECIES: restriction endonuclease subunit S [unclassified Aeromonas]
MSSEWVERSIVDVCAQVFSGGTPKSSIPEFFDRGSIPWLKTKEVNYSKIIETENFITELGLKNSSAKLVPINSVIVAMYGNGDTAGRVAINKIALTTNQACCNLVIDSARADYRFVYYYLQSQYAKLVDLKNGGAQQNLNAKLIKDYPIIVPSITEQREIGSFLESLDDRISLLCETNATLEDIAQALFKSWFVDFDPVHARARGEQPAGLAPEVAALFPDSFEESALGMIPRGWKLMQFGEFIDRQSVGKKYDQKSALEEGSVPILDQGKSGVIGFHNDKPSVCASLVSPVVVFANHTCYMRLITFDFSAIQNVLPFIGKGVDTVWAFYATKDRVKFSEYKGHWPEFVIQKTIVPNQELTEIFRNMVDPLICSMRNNELQAQTLANLRDTLLPRLISGQLRLPEAEAMVEGAS